jgi:hypothetical protein
MSWHGKCGLAKAGRSHMHSSKLHHLRTMLRIENAVKINLESQSHQHNIIQAMMPLFVKLDTKQLQADASNPNSKRLDQLRSKPYCR